MEKLERQKVVISEQEAASLISSGMTVALGGFITILHPMAIIRQIIKNRVRNLTIVGSGSAGLEVDLLIGAGCVKKLVSPYVGLESLAPIGPMFRAMAQRGELDVWECDEGHLYTGLMAASQLLPFAPWRGGIGTSYPEINPDLKVFQDPIRGEKLIAVPAINVDVALFHVGYSDIYGNVQHVGGSWSDILIHKAADKTIVQVDKVISNEEIRRCPERTTMYADAIVRVPYGSHPYASPGFYLEDQQHLKEYIDAANSFLKNNDSAPFEAYLDKYVYTPGTHTDYLETIGIKRLLSLYEY